MWLQEIGPGAASMGEKKRKQRAVNLRRRYFVLRKTYHAVAEGVIGAGLYMDKGLPAKSVLGNALACRPAVSLNSVVNLLALLDARMDLAAYRVREMPPALLAAKEDGTVTRWMNTTGPRGHITAARPLRPRALISSS
jgi:hypothetical protein